MSDSTDRGKENKGEKSSPKRKASAKLKLIKVNFQSVFFKKGEKHTKNTKKRN